VKTFRFGPRSHLRKLIAFSPGGLVTITIPSSVETISGMSFSWCTRLQSVDFEVGSKLRSIEGFNYCLIKELDIPDSVETMAGFEDSHIGIIHFGPDTKIRVIYGFQGCSFKSLEFPPSVEQIGHPGYIAPWPNSKICFALRQVESIKFAPGSKLRILAAFQDFTVNSIELPDSLTQIDTIAFRSMDFLSPILFGANSQLRVIDGFRASNMKEIDIPE
jgi:hypothetical protein